jgi:hypothetical protein
LDADGNPLDDEHGKNTVSVMPFRVPCVYAPPPPPLPTWNQCPRVSR